MTGKTEWTLKERCKTFKWVVTEKTEKSCERITISKQVKRTDWWKNAVKTLIKEKKFA